MKLGRPRAPRSRSLDDALLPLVNVVFLLMVFFLAAGRLGGPKPIDSAPQSAHWCTSSSSPGWPPP